jgi:hypothetical protein
MSMNGRGVLAAALATAVAIAIMPAELHVQTGRHPYRPVDGLQAGKGPGRLREPWAKLPGGREMASPGGLDIDGDGKHI